MRKEIIGCIQIDDMALRPTRKRDNVVPGRAAVRSDDSAGRQEDEMTRTAKLDSTRIASHPCVAFHIVAEGHTSP